jgi:hypothetical protein
VWPVRVRTVAPVATSHSRTVLSGSGDYRAGD